jgi:hypothetical protein
MGANLLAKVVCLAHRNPAGHRTDGFSFFSSSTILALRRVRAQGRARITIRPLKNNSAPISGNLFQSVFNLYRFQLIVEKVKK